MSGQLQRISDALTRERTLAKSVRLHHSKPLAKALAKGATQASPAIAVSKFQTRQLPALQRVYTSPHPVLNASHFDRIFNSLARSTYSLHRMQRSLTGAQSLLGGLILRNGVCLRGSTFRLTNQCTFSTQLSESDHTSQRTGQASATPVAVTLSWSSPAERKFSGQQPVASSPAARVIYVRPSIIKRRAEAALRIRAKASLKAAKDKVELIERNAASKAKQKKISETAAKLKAARIARTAAARATLIAAKTKKRMVAINVAARVKARLKAKKLQAIQVSTKVSFNIDCEQVCAVATAELKCLRPWPTCCAL